MGKGGNRQSGFRRRFFLWFAHRQAAVLHRGGKHDLRAGTAKLLQMVDKGIQLLRGAKQHFNQHAVIAGHAVALHNIAAALDVCLLYTSDAADEL